MKYRLERDYGTNYIKATGTWPKTRLGALKESIKKWKWLSEQKGLQEVQIDGMSCALCKVYVYKGNCMGCPVAEATGEDFCVDTPLDSFVDAQDKNARNSVLQSIAMKEAKFLESLLPKPKKEKRK